MIKEILKFMALGNLSLAEIGQRLKISRETLKSRLDLMERMGYIETCCDESYEKTDACGLCPSAKVCSEQSPQAPKIISYRLTEKGKIVIGDDD
jgi:DNA-binding transcriptional regulator LsrR (DeoR family)